jgi:nucleolar MIF4G domain-containing protein 1
MKNGANELSGMNKKRKLDEDHDSLISSGSGPKFSEKIMELAKAQHMNTDIRRAIFCIIVSAEDYTDAFMKLMKLSLKKQQEREIVYVLVHCGLNEKVYNSYYAYLMQKFSSLIL